MAYWLAEYPNEDGEAKVDKSSFLAWVKDTHRDRFEVCEEASQWDVNDVDTVVSLQITAWLESTHKSPTSIRPMNSPEGFLQAVAFEQWMKENAADAYDGIQVFDLLNQHQGQGGSFAIALAA